MARAPAPRLGAPARYRITVERTDGGEAIEEREAVEVALIGGMLRVSGQEGPIFAGEAWNWIEITRLEYEASLAPALARPPAAAPAPRRIVRRAKAKEPI